MYHDLKEKVGIAKKKNINVDSVKESGSEIHEIPEFELQMKLQQRKKNS